MKNLFGTIGSLWNVPIGPPEETYRTMTPETIEEWASLEADLSYGYKTGRLPASSQFEDGSRYVGEVMVDLDSLFLHHFPDLNKSYLAPGGFREKFHAKLEDPGMLHNAIYFDVAKDPDMLGFYWHTWNADMAKSMDFLHNFGWDPYGRGAPVDKNGAWYHMSMLEGMNNSERIKIKSFVCKARSLQEGLDRPINIFSFGGGTIPERHYGLPYCTITAFDSGKKPDLAQLFPDPAERSRIRYVHEDLRATIKYPELFGTFDLGEMHGLALYLGIDGTVKALLLAEKLLQNGGLFTFDLLVVTESMRRVFWTQWPVAQKDTMVFTSEQEAKNIATKIIGLANTQLATTGTTFLVAPSETTQVGAWGTTGVRFYLKKHQR